jgi:hypothetical protein
MQALGFAYKSLNECNSRCINRSMAEYLNLPLLQLNLIERQLFASLDYNVHVPVSEILAKKE